MTRNSCNNVSDITDSRVPRRADKTLAPQIHAGILAMPQTRAYSAGGIAGRVLIDIDPVKLYPFKQTISKLA
jgi:AICAR transformylase/IMP cyclohydrolase PurH